MSKITTSLFQEMVQAASTRLNKTSRICELTQCFPMFRMGILVPTWG